MLMFVIGGATVVVVGYGIKRYIDSKVYSQAKLNSNCVYYKESAKNHNFIKVYETKVSLFESTIAPYVEKMKKIRALPSSIAIKNDTIGFQKEIYSSDLVVYDTANALALELNEQLLQAKKLLDTYIYKMNMLISELHTPTHFKPQESKTFYTSVKFVNILTNISHMRMVEQDDKINPEFIKELNNLKDTMPIIQEEMNELDKVYYSVLEDTAINKPNEIKIDFKRMAEALSKGTKHKMVSVKVEGENAIVSCAMNIIKEAKKKDDVQAIIVNFYISHDLPLDMIDKALDRIYKSLGHGVEITAGTQCNCDYSNNVASCDGVIVW